MSDFTRCQDHKHGPHGGVQYRAPKQFECGCDAGICQTHAEVQRVAAMFPERGSGERPRVPLYIEGEPQFCTLHTHDPRRTQ